MTRYKTAVVVACWIVAVSCGKKEAASPVPPAAPAQAADSDNTEALPARTVGETAASGSTASRNPTPEGEAVALEGAIHPFMTSQLRLFIQQKGRLPESFGEFATARMDSVPRPPAGMEFVIDGNAQVVKVVRKSRK